MMNAISRRKFLQLAGATMLAAALPVAGGGQNRQSSRRIRIRPLESSGNISTAEKNYFQRARFASAADAMRAAASRGTRAEVYEE